MNMSIKLKALGAGLLAMVAMCALAVTNASALGGGTFDVGTAHTELLVEQDGNAPILHSLGDSIECAKQTYTGTATTSNFTALTVAPHYA
jgi:hypothetical protein